MIILDTDILSLIQRDDSEVGLRIRARIADVPTGELVVTTIVTYQEQCKGWLAYIGRAKSEEGLIEAYDRFAIHVENYRHMKVLAYDLAATNEFRKLQARRLGLGTMDLRIAAIALSRRSLLVSRNLRDFSKIEELRVEDWSES